MCIRDRGNIASEIGTDLGNLYSTAASDLESAVGSVTKAVSPTVSTVETNLEKAASGITQAVSPYTSEVANIASPYISAALYPFSTQIESIINYAEPGLQQNNLLALQQQLMNEAANTATQYQYGPLNLNPYSLEAHVIGIPAMFQNIGAGLNQVIGDISVSYTHLTLPTKRIV